MIFSDKTSKAPTPESRQFARDEKARIKHMSGAKRGFRALLKELKPIAEQAKLEFPKRDKQSISRRGRLFNKQTKAHPRMLSFLDLWIGAESQHPKAYSWRSSVINQARNVLVYGSKLADALSEIEKQSAKGFQALTMFEAQAPLRDAVPAQLMEFLPKNIVVEVDEKGTIKKVTDRFENEYLPLGKKIDKMRTLLRGYNKIVRQVKRDIKSSDEITKMSAIITAIIMETGIRPGKRGNGKIVLDGGEEVFVETFGAITLGPSHVNFVRESFAELSFVGKKGGINLATLSDGSIIKALSSYVKNALTKGSKFIFVTDDGVPYTYSDLQKYFRLNFKGLSPTDFRKLRATEAVLSSLREEQVELYRKVSKFSADSEEDLRERVTEAVVAAVDSAVRKSQKALSHDNAATTVRSYINPEVILRFLSTGKASDTIQDAILSDRPLLRFDPKVFLDVAAQAGELGRTASLGDLLSDLEDDLEDDLMRMASLGDLLSDLEDDLEGNANFRSFKVARTHLKAQRVK